MKFNFSKSLILPSILAVMLIWIFSRPLSSLGMHIYNITGANISGVFHQIQNTREQASDILEAEKELSKIKKQNKFLEMENMSLKAQVAKLDKYRKKLKFKRKFSYKTIPAEIIGRSPDTWHKQIIINKGRKAGVSVSKGVFTENAIVGQIVKVNQNNSVAQLVFDKNFKMGAKIKRSNIYGVLSGNNPGPVSLEFVTVGSDVRKGDVVVTAGISLDDDETSYPENYPIGEVVDVSKNPDAIDLDVKVALYENLKSTREIFVMR